MSLISGMSNEDYHSTTDLSSSGLKLIDQSPAHYKCNKDNPKPPTHAMQIGTAFHSILLEPDTINDVIAIAPDVNRRTKAGKAEYAAFEAGLGGRIALKNDEHLRLIAMKDAAYNHSEARRWLETNGEVELSCFWTDRRGFGSKCRPDKLTNSGVVVDLKSTEDASPRGFAKSCAKYKYHWQAAFYLDGLTVETGYKHQDFILIAVEKNPPYGVGVYLMPQVYIDIAAQQIEPILDLYSKCTKYDTWPCYSDDLEPLELPVWALHVGDE